MSILDRLRQLFTSDADPPGADRIREVRQEAASRREQLEGELGEVREQREEALLQGDAEVDELEAREDEIEREIDRLEVVHRRLGERLERALTREKTAEAEELVAGIPEVVEDLRRAKEQYETARRQLGDMLAEANQLRAHLKRKSDVEIRLSHGAVRKVKAVEDDIAGNVSQSIEALTPPTDPDTSEKVVVYDVHDGRRRFVGPWTDQELRERGFNAVRTEGSPEDVLIPEGEDDVDAE